MAVKRSERTMKNPACLAARRINCFANDRPLSLPYAAGAFGVRLRELR